MKKNIVAVLLLIGSFVTLSLFQNCSKITPQDLAKISGEAKVTANGAGENIVNNDVIVEVTDLDQGLAPMDVQPAAEVVKEGEKNPERPPSEITDIATDTEVDIADANDVSKEPKVADNDSDDNSDDNSDDDSDDDDSKAVAACVQKKFRNSLAGSVFKDLHGKFEIVSDQIDEISNTHGKILARSISSQSLVRKISGHHGKLILCNLNVDLIENGHGKVVLVNSHVKEILNHKGKVKSINSTIEKFSGRLKVVAF